MRAVSTRSQAGASSRRSLAETLTGTAGGRLLLRGLTVAVIIGLWQWAGDDSIGLLFPTFTRTLAAFWSLVTDGRLVWALLITAQALAAGLAIMYGLGVPLGVVIARLPIVDRIVSPYLTFLVAVPIIAIVPVIQIIFGLTFAARVTVIVLFGISYVVINSAIAVRRVDRNLIDMAHSFGAGRWRTLFDVVLPAAVPGIMTGVRISLGQALIGMVVAELTIVGAGIGSLIAELQGRFQVAPVLAIAVTIVLVGVGLMSLVEMLEKRLARWSH